MSNIDIFDSVIKNEITAKLIAGETEGLEKRVNNLISQDPKDLDYYFILIDLYKFEGKDHKQKKVLEFIDRFLDESQGSKKHFGLFILGNYYNGEGKYKKAMEYLNKLNIDHNPTYGISMLDSYRGMGWNKKYIKLLEELFEDNDSGRFSAVILEYLRYYTENFDKEKAKDAIERRIKYRDNGHLIYYIDKYSEDSMFERLKSIFVGGLEFIKKIQE